MKDTPSERNGQRRAWIQAIVWLAPAWPMALLHGLAADHGLEGLRMATVGIAAIWSVGGLFAGAAVADWWRFSWRRWPFEPEG
jgi:hypothetical protein